MDNRLLWRLALFFIFFPVIILVMTLEWEHHLALNLIIVGASMISAMELRELLVHRGFPINALLPPIYGLALPALGYLETAGLIPPAMTFTIMTTIILLLFIRQIFTNQDLEIQTVLNKVSGNLFIVIYPGLFFYFIVKFAGDPDATLVYVVFALMTFGNDALAWLMGNLFGRRSFKPFVVSPNKSLIGFVGGLLASVVVGVSAFYALPAYFHSQLMGRQLWIVLVFSLLIGVTTIIGDLFESALKRSAGVKDSGTIIPGRGGMLDSIDSLLFSAPVFFLFMTITRS